MQTTDSLEKTLMLGKIKDERRRGREGEMVGWHHWLDGHEFEQALGVGDGQGGLVCCSPWSRKESDMTEQLNWRNELRMNGFRQVQSVMVACVAVHRKTVPPSVSPVFYWWDWAVDLWNTLYIIFGQPNTGYIYLWVELLDSRVGIALSPLESASFPKKPCYFCIPHSSAL